MILSRSTALGYPILNRKSERELLSAWKSTRAPEALERITLAYMRLCFNIASYYTSNLEHQSDLAQEGVFGIRRALDEYDPSYGTLFSTFVRRYIQNAISDKVSVTTTDVSIPSRVLLDARAGRTSPETNPSAHAVIAPAVLLDATAQGNGTAVYDLFPDGGLTPEESVVRRSEDDYFRQLVQSALHVLPSRECEIIVRRHLSDPGDTLEEIGRDLGITRERVRQLEAASMKKIRYHIGRLAGGDLFT